MAWLREIPLWAILAFSAAIAVAYSPNVIHVFGIHTDYDNLYTRSPHFLHPEAEHLFAVARPVAALFSNLTMLPVLSIGDYRWTRIFSIIMVCVLGAQMMGNCIQLLRVRTLDAVAVAIATFVVPAFTYSVLVAAAWAPHLLTIFIAFGAYTCLGRSNLQSIPFLVYATRRDYPGLRIQFLKYASVRPVWIACILYQLALYDYPPNALIIAVFPVIGILFSRAPRAYRTLLAARDIAFIGVNLVLYFVSVKLLYIPFARLFTAADSDPPANMSAFLLRLTAGYRFKLDTDPVQILGRLRHLLGVAGDLWFMPQAHIRFLTGIVFLVAVAVAGAWVRHTRTVPMPARENGPRLRFGAWDSEGAVAVYITAACFILAGAPVLAASGGFVTYRTVAVSTAVAAIAFVYAIRSIVEIPSSRISKNTAAASTIADVALALTIFAAVGSTLYTNYLTMRLARSEFAYFTAMAHQAIDSKAKTIFLVDPRPIMLPEDIPVVYDQQGRAAPPYELGCFSDYCIETGSILHIAIEELGHSDREFTILTPQGDEPVPGLTCAMLTGPAPTYPPNPNARSIAVIDHFRTLTPLMCVDYSLAAWHDLGL